MLRSITRRLPLVANRLPSVELFLAPGQQKYLLAWFRSRRKDYLLDHAIPWITYDAAAFLRANLKKGIRVFEYGSGASTLFWATFDAHTIAIEHDPEWVETLRKRFPPTYDIDLRLVEADPLTTQASPRDVSDPYLYQSDWEAWAMYTFKGYASQIDSFPDGHFDVVMVDGQARASCILHGHRKVKPGGYLVIDNTDFPSVLSRTLPLLGGFERKIFKGITPIWGRISQTDIFIRKG